MIPTLINGYGLTVPGDPPGGVAGSLCSSGYCFIRGRWMFSTADVVGGSPSVGGSGSFSIWDVQNVSLTSKPVLVGQIVDPNLYFAEGLWIDEALTHAIVCVMGGTSSNLEQLAIASVVSISIAPCIAAYLAATAYVAPEIVYTISDNTNLGSPENLLVVGSYGYVANLFSDSSGTRAYTKLDLSNLAHPAVVDTLTHSGLYQAVYSVEHGGKIYVTAREGAALTVVDVTTFTILGSCYVGTSMTGIDVIDYPALGKTVAIVAGYGGNCLFSIDVTVPSAMAVLQTLTDITSFNRPSNVHIVGTVAFTTAYNLPSGITRVDISDPYAMAVLSFTSTTTLGLESTQKIDHLEIPQTGVPTGLEGRGYITDTSTSIGGVYVVQVFGTADAPTFAPAAGTYESTQLVTLSSSAGATIRYTIDGSTPSESVGTIYTGPVSVASTTTIKAIAYGEGWTTSTVSSAIFRIQPVPPPPPPPTNAGAPAQRQRGIGTAVLIPLTNAPNQRLTVDLPINGSAITLNLRVCYNEEGGFWVMDVFDQSGVLMVASVPLITGAWPGGNILAPWDYLWIGSAFVINQSGGASDWPDSSGFGDGPFRLLWDSN